MYIPETSFCPTDTSESHLQNPALEVYSPLHHW